MTTICFLITLVYGSRVNSNDSVKRKFRQHKYSIICWLSDFLYNGAIVYRHNSPFTEDQLSIQNKPISCISARSSKRVLTKSLPYIRNSNACDRNVNATARSQRPPGYSFISAENVEIVVRIKQEMTCQLNSGACRKREDLGGDCLRSLP